MELAVISNIFPNEGVTEGLDWRPLDYLKLDAARTLKKPKFKILPPINDTFLRNDTSYRVQKISPR